MITSNKWTLVSAIAILAMATACSPSSVQEGAGEAQQESGKDSNELNATLDSGPFDYSLTIAAEQFPVGTNISVYQLAHADSPAAVTYLHEDGPLSQPTMSFTGSADEVRLASLRVTPPRESGVKYMDFMVLLEPGETTVSFNAIDRLVQVDGGLLNDTLFDNWRETPEYAQAFATYESNLKTINEESSVWRSNNPDAESLPAEFTDRYAAVGNDVTRLKNDALTRTFDSAQNASMKLATLTLRREMDLGEKLTLLQTLEPQMKDSEAWNVAYSRIARALESIAADASIGVGSTIKDFSAKHFEGDAFRLSEVLGAKDYILVEFWASWCGPCRAEIPHMKTAYGEYAEQGFEIVSFTLDHELEAWEDASYDEELPWINTGDLLAYTSPVAKAYGVIGIPKNYLIDGQTGEILFADLRGEQLDQTLEELFGD